MTPRSICFLVGSMAISGGTYVIVQHAAYLHRCGYVVTLAVQEPFTAQTLAWHDEIAALRVVLIDTVRAEKFDLVIATWWKTVFELSNFDAARYAYFVQSVESRFYPESEIPLRALVDATYTFPLAYVTEATWIQGYLGQHFGQDAALVRNGIRKDVYRDSGPAVAPRPQGREPVRVLVEGHFGVAFKNTALAVHLAKAAGVTDIWVLTATPVNWLPGVKRVFSRVPMIETAEIYRSCDILIKLSTVEGMFGPPLEMFHCGGTAVVFDVSGHDEYIIHSKNAIVVPRGDVGGVVNALSGLASDREQLHRLQRGARETAARWLSWEESSCAFREWVDQCLSAPAIGDRAVFAEMTQRAYADYTRDEQQRLSRNPDIVRRHKLSAIASRMPPSVVRAVKKFEAAGEVLWGGRTVR